MNSLRMYVVDKIGDKFLFTTATRRPGQEAAFRKHARWWMGGGYRVSPINKQPCHPCRIVIEIYQDETSPD